MGKKKATTPDVTNLRQQTIGLMDALDNADPFADFDRERLIHELEVHQIELENQNEELQQARTALEIERNHLSDLYTFAPVGYFTLDKRGIIRRVNLACAALLHGVSSQLMGQPFLNFISEANRTIFKAFVEQMTSSLKKESCDVSIDSSEDRSCYLHIEGIVSEDLIEYHIAVMDVTEQAMLHAELLRLSRGQESEIAEHRAAQEVLQHHSQRLAVSNKELDAFAYTISHDLQAPLRAIEGFSRMLLKKVGEKLNDDEKRQFNVIRDNAAKMKQLLDDLLAFSRWSSRAATFSTIDMLQLVNEVWQNLIQAHSNRKIDLTIELLPPAHGDVALIRQVLINLLSNAIKFTGKKDISLIHIGATSGDSENVYFVRDNGAGFDMNRYHKLFGVFQRLHSNEEYEGNGAGLAIVQRLINRHGGRVWADSKIDEETTFFFTLPKAAKT